MDKLRAFLDCSAVWGCLLTLTAFALGSFLNRKTGKAWCNPLLLGTVIVIAVLRFTGVPYTAYQASAGPISYLLLPATVCLAVPLYQKWDLLVQNLLPIGLGILMGTLTSLGSILLLSWAMGLPHEAYVTLLPKSVTTAIGMDVATELGGIGALTGAVIILTGIAGNLLAGWVCRVFRIQSPMARGLAIGTASHAIGTARALELGETEGAMSGLAIAVAGILTALCAPLFAGLL